MLKEMISVQSSIESEYYGYGIWLEKIDEDIFFPYFQGYDPGVSFISAYNLATKTSITAISNFGCDVWKLKRSFDKIIDG